MTKLPEKINVTVVMKQLESYSKELYKDTWQPELQQKAFIEGAKKFLWLIKSR